MYGLLASFRRQTPPENKISQSALDCVRYGVENTSKTINLSQLMSLSGLTRAAIHYGERRGELTPITHERSYPADEVKTFLSLRTGKQKCGQKSKVIVGA